MIMSKHEKAQGKFTGFPPILTRELHSNYASLSMLFPTM